MSGFSPEWLALRELVDHRSRNAEIADAVRARFQSRARVTVVDLGCGTGSNLRATAPLLPAEQAWTLVDHDAALLEAARQTLRGWADRAEDAEDGGVQIDSQGKRIAVQFRRADLNRDLEAALGGGIDLVTASALFDLCSPASIKALVRAIAQRQAVFYTVLTYNGLQRWTPRQPADNAMVGAFHAHQMTDKGLGPSAGPTAPAHLADALRLSGYAVLEGDSPWRLGTGEGELIVQLAAGFAEAVRETGQVDGETIARWVKVAHTAAEVGHTDTLGVPG